MGWTGLAMVLLASFLYSKDTLFPGLAALLPAVGTGLLMLPGLNDATNAVTRVFSSRLLVRMGDLSYSWYLWHWPLIVFTYASWPGDPTIPVVVAALGSIGLAWLTERAIESPIRYRPETQRRPVWQVATLCIVAPIGAWILQVQSPLLTNNIKPLAQLREMEKAYMEIGCDSSTPYDPTSSTCKWGEGKERKIVLLGDSNARQFIPVLREVAAELDSTFQAATFPDCPFLHTRTFRAGRENHDCEYWVSTSFERVLNEKPKLLIIAHATDGYITSTSWSFVTGDGDHLVDPTERSAAIESSMAKLAVSAEQNGIQLLLIDPIPKFLTPEYEPSQSSRNGGECSMIGLRFGLAHCILSRSLNDPLALNERSPNTFAERSARRINFDEDICLNGRCVTFEEGWLYRDRSHLSILGTHRVKTRLSSSIAPLLSN